MPKPTYEELVDLVVALRAHIVRQDARIADLERQVAATSRNSSKPPSCDGLGNPNPKSLRGKSGRKPGGRGCGAGLAHAPEVGLARRQVFDLPPIAIRVSEHELASRRCRCGVSTTADAPAGVNAPVQYGPRIKAIMVYLIHGPVPVQAPRWR